MDIVDLGLRESVWQGVAKMKPKIRLVFQVDEMNTETDPPSRFTVSKQVTASWSDKGELYKFLKMWGQLPTQEQMEAGCGIDYLIGTNGQLNVKNEKSEKDPTKSFANIVAVMPISARTNKMKAENYVRAQDRPPREVVRPAA